MDTSPAFPIRAQTRHRSVDLLEAAWGVTARHSLESPHYRWSELESNSGSPDVQAPSELQRAPAARHFAVHESAPLGEWPLVDESQAHFLQTPPTEEDKGESEPWIARPTSTQHSSSVGLVAGEKVAAELSPSGSAPAPPAVTFSKVHEVLFVVNVCLAQLLTLASLAVTVAPLDIIGVSFNVTNPGQLSWYTASFSLTVGTFILPAGRLGDMYGHRKVFMFGWAWFAAWSLIAGFSHASGSLMLSICRGFQGIGPALLVPNAMALIGRTFPLGKKRNLVFSLFGGMGPIGFILGAVFSSAFAQFVCTYRIFTRLAVSRLHLILIGWPWAFWSLAIVCVFALGLSFFVIPLDALPSQLGSKAPTPAFDFLGAFTGVTGLILVNFAFNQAPIVSWAEPYIPVLLATGLLSLAAFLHIELHTASQPLIPLRGLQREAGFALACIAAGWASHGIWIYYFFLFLER
ncbi:hypothetical protein LTR66_010342, partial [Elasticomyces elasticus]